MTYPAALAHPDAAGFAAGADGMASYMVDAHMCQDYRYAPSSSSTSTEEDEVGSAGLLDGMDGDEDMLLSCSDVAPGPLGGWAHPQPTAKRGYGLAAARAAAAQAAAQAPLSGAAPPAGAPSSRSRTAGPAASHQHQNQQQQVPGVPTTGGSAAAGGGNGSQQVLEKMCTKCKVTKPLDGFFRDPSKKFGHTSWCKACFGAYSQERKLFNQQLQGPKITEKQCSICRAIKPAEDFIRDARRATGLDARCRVCRREQHKARKAARAASGAPVAAEKACRRCKEVKPASAFKKHSYTSSGLDSWCKACCAERRKEKPLQKVKEPTIASKRCLRCRMVKMADEFTRDTNKRTGLGPRCKACENEYRKEKRMLKRAACSDPETCADRGERAGPLRPQPSPPAPTAAAYIEAGATAGAGAGSNARQERPAMQLAAQCSPQIPRMGGMLPPPGYMQGGMQLKAEPAMEPFGADMFGGHGGPGFPGSLGQPLPYHQQPRNQQQQHMLLPPLGPYSSQHLSRRQQQILAQQQLQAQQHHAMMMQQQHHAAVHAHMHHQEQQQQLPDALVQYQQAVADGLDGMGGQPGANMAFGSLGGMKQELDLVPEDYELSNLTSSLQGGGGASGGGFGGDGLSEYLANGSLFPGFDMDMKYDGGLHDFLSVLD